MKGRTQDAVFFVVVRCLRIVTGKHVGKTAGTPFVFRNRRVCDTEVVEGHVAFAQMMPLHRLGMAPELPVDRWPEDFLVFVESCAVLKAAVRDPRHRIPVTQVQLQQIIMGTQGVEQAEVVTLLVQIVHIFCHQCGAPCLEVVPCIQTGGVLHKGEEFALQQRPRWRCTQVVAFDGG